MTYSPMAKAHCRDRLLASLAEGAEAGLGAARVGVNLYHTPPGRAAFPLHYDTTEIIVLQLAGRKDWALYGPAVPHARDGEASHGP